MSSREKNSVAAKEAPARRKTASAKAAEPARPAPLEMGISPAMRALTAEIHKVASTQASVLIVGESGSGKELVARAIHENSKRADKPFVPVNCGAIPASLIEAELFGHEKGSFTGATAQNIGYFEHASGGTIFLDEITEMPIDMQVQLLRVLESGAFHRVGGLEEVRVDVRVIAATNRDPYEAIREGTFREDLLYRLAVVPLFVPPLRERPDDVAFLADRFLAGFNAKEKTAKVFAPSAYQHLAAREWPGNVRELKNAVHRAFILADDAVEIAPVVSKKKQADVNAWQDGELRMNVGTKLADAQKNLILATLEHHQGDKRLAAETLGISLKTLYNRLGTYENRASVA